MYIYGNTKLNCCCHFSLISMSYKSSKSNTFDEWLEEKKSLKQQQQKKEKEKRLRKLMEQESKKLARLKGKSFEDWRISKSQPKRELPITDKRKDEIVREDPGRYYALSYERWLQRTGVFDLC